MLYVCNRVDRLRRVTGQDCAGIKWRSTLKQIEIIQKLHSNNVEKFEVITKQGLWQIVTLVMDVLYFQLKRRRLFSRV